MDQISIGKFIAQKRKEQNLTQEQLAERLGVSNKTIINRCARLALNGFLLPIIVKERIRSYTLSDFTKNNSKQILDLI